MTTPTLERPAEAPRLAAKAPRPEPRHSFSDFQDDGSAICTSGRSGDQYAVGGDTCGCFRAVDIRRDSCSHRDQYRENLQAIRVIRRSWPLMSPVASERDRECCLHCSNPVYRVFFNTGVRQTNLTLTVCTVCERTRAV